MHKTKKKEAVRFLKILARSTDGGNDGGGKVERAAELPLMAGLVRDGLDDDRLQHLIVGVADVVLSRQLLSHTVHLVSL